MSRSLFCIYIMYCPRLHFDQGVLFILLLFTFLYFSYFFNFYNDAEEIPIRCVTCERGQEKYFWQNFLGFLSELLTKESFRSERLTKEMPNGGAWVYSPDAGSVHRTFQLKLELGRA